MKLIYLIESSTSLIKIGCSKDPWTRCRSIGLVAPFRVAVIAQWPGTNAEEFALHRQFAEQHEFGEWFRNEGALAGFVAQRRGLNMDPADTPSWARDEPLPVEDRRQNYINRRARLRQLQQSEAA